MKGTPSEGTPSVSEWACSKPIANQLCARRSRSGYFQRYYQERILPLVVNSHRGLNGCFCPVIILVAGFGLMYTYIP
jgi:hypothetical protein